MKRVVTSYDYKGYTIYYRYGKWYIYTEAKGVNPMEFVSDKEAEEFIDSMTEDTEPESKPKSEAESKPVEDQREFVIAKILKREPVDTYTNYMWLQPNGRYLYRGQNDAKRFGYEEAKQFIEKPHKDDDVCIYKVIQVTKKK